MAPWPPCFPRLCYYVYSYYNLVPNHSTARLAIVSYIATYAYTFYMNIGITVHIRAQRSPGPPNVNEEFELTVIVNVNVEAANNLPSQGKHVASGYMITIYLAYIYTNSNLVSEASVPTTDALSLQEGIIMFVH